MDSSKLPPSSGSRPPGYGYGGYGSYPVAAYGEPGAPRTVQDYLLILRERKWHILAVFLFVFSSVAVYTFTQTKIYQATASVQIFRRDPTVMQVQAVVDNDVRSLEDLNTLVKVLESSAIIQRVADRLTGDELKQFTAPYEKGDDSAPATPARILAKNRKVISPRTNLLILVQYRHPDRIIAAKVANYFVEEFISYNSRVRIDESMKAVEDLSQRAKEQQRKVEEQAVDLQNYREKHNLVSLDQRKDIVTEKLKALNLYVTQVGARLKDAEVRWQQVKQRRDAGLPLTELTFIASQPNIAELNQQLANQKIALAQLKERYRDKHPKMIEAVNSLAQVERELDRAVNSTAAAIEAEYQTALRNDEEARSSLSKQETQSLGLDRAAVEYEAKERELKINEQLLQHLLGRMRETSITSNIESQNARIIDRAAPSQPEDYVKPSFLINLTAGFVGGLGLGLVFALGLSFFDDRVKTAFDIETIVGLPLISVIPQVSKMDASEKVRLAVSNADPQVSEAFLTLHSSLNLKEESKNARCILVTSTLPGEGKSFTTSNLALTYAAHGERVILIDCDLRRPSIHRSFKLNNSRGVIDVCGHEANLDDVIIKNVHPNFDVLPTGGRAKNPTHVLNSQEFELMLVELRKRYDRIFLDTPPIAAVSDALIILPLADGSIFTVFFNKVRRKSAQYSARRLLSVRIPNFGAVLNGLNLEASGYYYSQYNDKAYREYYMTGSDDQPQR